MNADTGEIKTFYSDDKLKEVLEAAKGNWSEIDKSMMTEKQKRTMKVSKMDTRSPLGQLRQRQIRKIGRNNPCPCGSGYKYKKCCLNK